MASEINSIKGTLIKLGFYPDEKSLLSDAFRALFEIRPELKTEIAIDLTGKVKPASGQQQGWQAVIWKNSRIYFEAGVLLLEYRQANRKAMKG